MGEQEQSRTWRQTGTWKDRLEHTKQNQHLSLTHSTGTVYKKLICFTKEHIYSWPKTQRHWRKRSGKSWKNWGPTAPQQLEEPTHHTGPSAALWTLHCPLNTKPNTSPPPLVHEKQGSWSSHADWPIKKKKKKTQALTIEIKAKINKWDLIKLTLFFFTPLGCSLYLPFRALRA